MCVFGFTTWISDRDLKLPLRRTKPLAGWLAGWLEILAGGDDGGALDTVELLLSQTLCAVLSRERPWLLGRLSWDALVSGRRGGLVVFGNLGKYKIDN